MKGDFHIHTNASDGDYEIKEIIFRAKQNNLTHIAITDHNTFGNHNLENVEIKDLIIIPGVEFDVERDIDNGTKMHILGLNINVNNAQLKKYFTKYHKRNLKLVLKLYKKIHKIYGVKIKESSLERTSKLSYYGIINKLAYKVIEQGLSTKKQRELADDIGIYLNKKRFNFHNEKLVLKLIKKAGGQSVLAHPCSMKLNNDDLDRRVRCLVNLGLNGIEIYHPNIKPEQTEFYKSLAKKYNLFTSGGSDFHRYDERPDVFVSDEDINKVSILSVIKDVKKF